MFPCGVCKLLTETPHWKLPWQIVWNWLMHRNHFQRKSGVCMQNGKHTSNTCSKCPCLYDIFHNDVYFCLEHFGVLFSELALTIWSVFYFRTRIHEESNMWTRVYFSNHNVCVMVSEAVYLIDKHVQKVNHWSWAFPGEKKLFVYFNISL